MNPWQSDEWTVSPLSPTAESGGVSAQTGSGVVRGGSKVRFFFLELLAEVRASFGVASVAPLLGGNGLPDSIREQAFGLMS